jgi:sterol desaturase/sphingolipid hydroxylase (fatty acid hydroxylase superfamily)
VAAAGVWLGLVGLHALSAGGHLSHVLAVQQSRNVGPALLVVVTLVFLAERKWPAVPRPAMARAHLVDAGYLVLFAFLVGPLVVLFSTGFSVVVNRYAHFLVLDRLPLAPRLVVVAAILVGMDAMNWLAHVANHRAASLWRFHALHHSQEDMSVFTTFRTHPFTHASYAVAALPALVLVNSGTAPAAAIIAYGCLVTLPHANLRWTYGPLGRLLVSPAFHRLHHANAPVAGRRAVNFGFVLVCWDRLARCAVFPDGREPVATGIAGQPVPLEQGNASPNLVRVMAAQIVQPFGMRAAMDGPS